MKDKKAKESKWSSFLSSLYINLDLFGREVCFTWNCEEKTKTTFGATMTIIQISVLVGYSFSNLNSVFNRLNPLIT